MWHWSADEMNQRQPTHSALMHHRAAQFTRGAVRTRTRKLSDKAEYQRRDSITCFFGSYSTQEHSQRATAAGAASYRVSRYVLPSGEASIAWPS